MIYDVKTGQVTYGREDFQAPMTHFNVKWDQVVRLLATEWRANGAMKESDFITKLRVTPGGIEAVL